MASTQRNRELCLRRNRLSASLRLIVTFNIRPLQETAARIFGSPQAYEFKYRRLESYPTDPSCWQWSRARNKVSFYSKSRGTGTAIPASMPTPVQCSEETDTESIQRLSN